MIRSLHWRLILGSLAGFSLVLAGGSVFVYLHIQQRLYADLDNSLLQRAVSLTSLIELDEDGIQVEWLEFGDEPPGHQEGVDHYQLWLVDGTLLAASPEWKGEPCPRISGSLESPRYARRALPGGRMGRSVEFEYQARVDLDDDDDEDEDEEMDDAEDSDDPDGAEEDSDEADADHDDAVESAIGPGPQIRVLIAKVDSVAPALAGIRNLFFGLWAGCVAIGGLVIGAVVRASLRQLAQLTAQIGELDDTVAGKRIALPGQSPELQPVTTELNRLLQRVEEALGRERNLTSNVAHELRTPISGLLNNLEVTLSKDRQAAEYRESSEECFEIAKRMHWLTNNLLSITRIDAGNVQLQNHIVPLEKSLREWWEPFAGRAEERDLTLVWDIEKGASLETDPEFLRVIVTNLFDNAVSYVTEGGSIIVHADAWGRISVGNDAVDVPENVVAHVFEPFFRNNESREEVGAHAGLGLSLCQRIVALLGGRISARTRETADWFEIRLELATG